MSIDYTAIADADIDGDIQAAHAALMSMTEQVSKGVHQITDLTIAKVAGMSDALIFLDGLDNAVAASVLDSRVIDWLKTEGIDVNHGDTQATLIGLAGGGFISSVTVNALLADGIETRNKFYGLTVSHLEKSRIMRAEGRA